jgi:uncharacterized phage protein (TIGR02220 family)
VTGPIPCAGASTIPEKKKEQEGNEKKAASRRSKPALCPQPIADRVIGHLNKVAGTAQRATAKGHRQLIQARMNDGATVDDFIHVIDVKAEQWMGSDMEQHLVPSTLFGLKHFDNYLGQKMGAGQGSLDLGTEAGKRAAWERAGHKQEYKPRPNLKEFLAKHEVKND